MKISKRFLFLGLIALTCGLATMTAQVTIGNGSEPKPFSVLELVSHRNKGLRLPQMNTAERNVMQAAFGANTVEAAAEYALLCVLIF